METNQTVADLYELIPDDVEAITEDEYLLSGVYREPDGAVYFVGGFDCPDCGCPAVIIRQATEGKSVSVPSVVSAPNNHPRKTASLHNDGN